MDYSQTIRLDIRDHNTYEQIYAKQYDKGYPLNFEITKDEEPFDLTDVIALFQMNKPDGNIIIADCTITDNIVSVDLTEQMTAINGKCYFQLALEDSNYNERITTITGTMKVDKSTITDDAVQSDSVLGIIIQSIEWAHIAQQSAEAASVSETNAENSAIKSESYAVGGTNSRTGEDTDNAKYYKEQANTYATNASNSATTATTKASEASASATNASNSASSAATKASEASASATAASASATTASDKATEASNSATASYNSAITSESYAVGGTNTRQDEDIDNSKYYYQQVYRLVQEIGGSLYPMGTIYFADLSSQPKQPGYMYNIIDSFITTNDFKVGAGVTVPAGSNVYYTADGYWDILATALVSGVKGTNEVNYRQGNVEISKDNIGLGNVENKSSSDIYNEWVIYSSTEPSSQDINGEWMQLYTP